MDTTLSPTVVTKPPLLWRGYVILLAIEAVTLATLWITTPRHAELPYAQALGWVGVGSMLLMQTYSIRRRLPRLVSLGSLRGWLEVHIFLGIQGALCVVYHGLGLRSWATVQGASYVLVGVVIASGIFGRYLYSRVPRALSGEVLRAEQASAEIAQLQRHLAHVSPELAARTEELLAGVPALDRRGLARRVAATGRLTRRALVEVSRLAGAAGPLGAPLLEVVRRRISLSRKLEAHVYAERLLRRWLLAHRPIAYVLAATLVLHVVAHFAYRVHS
jgi:dihydropyrimidine dehydrogenase (NAD+) subunit PreT